MQHSNGINTSDSGTLKIRPIFKLFLMLRIMKFQQQEAPFMVMVARGGNRLTHQNGSRHVQDYAHILTGIDDPLYYHCNACVIDVSGRSF
jgi:hypothetical protein